MRRTKELKAMAVVLTAAMVAGTLTGCGAQADRTPEEMTQAVNENKTDEDMLMDAMSAVSTVGAQMAQKQETVYVKTNASGGVDSVVVSDWLKNSKGSGELMDGSDLSDIKNLKGSQQYAKSGDELVWDAEGEDIYYQGTTDKALPVDVNISYKLDGKEISPEELAGKDGHVEIKMNYVNHESQTVDINGEKETIYTPFAVMSGMMLDNEKFSNVSVTNGTVICDGNKDIVVGMAFPGLVDSLNGKKVADDTILTRIEDEIRIPSEITVEADTNDFELGMTLTMVSSDVMDALGLENVDTKSTQLPDLHSYLEEFENAGTELKNGTGQLRNGAGQLAGGAGELASGSGELVDGVKKYTDGVSQVNDGAAKLHDGAGRLDSGVGTLKNGIDQVDAGAGELSNGIGSATEGADQVKDGIGRVNDGASALQDGADKVAAGLKGLQAQVGSLSQLKDGLGQAAAGAGQIRDNLDALAQKLNAAAFSELPEVSPVSAEGVSAPDASTYDTVGYVSVSVSTDGLDEDAAAAVASAVAEAESQANAQIDEANSRIGAANGTIGALAGGYDAANAQIAAAVEAANAQIDAANGIIGMANAQISGAASAIKEAAGAVSQLSAAAGNLSDSLYGMQQALDVDALNAGIGQLAGGASSVADGAAQLSAGTQKLSGGADALSDGMHKLLSGANDLKSGTSRLSSGASELKSGSSDLYNGTGSLVSGVQELNGNSGSLLSGAMSLFDGATQLSSGADDLYAGVQKLDDGMVKFDQEGIQKLSSLFDTDLDSMEQRVKAITDAGKAYKSFGGSAGGEDGSVRFVIESAAVKPL